MSILDLPLELTVEIFDYFIDEDLLTWDFYQISKVCRVWRDVCKKSFPALEERNQANFDRLVRKKLRHSRYFVTCTSFDLCYLGPEFNSKTMTDPILSMLRPFERTDVMIIRPFKDENTVDFLDKLSKKRQLYLFICVPGVDRFDIVKKLLSTGILKRTRGLHFNFYMRGEEWKYVYELFTFLVSHSPLPNLRYFKCDLSGSIPEQDNQEDKASYKIFEFLNCNPTIRHLNASSWFSTGKYLHEISNMKIWYRLKCLELYNPSCGQETDLTPFGPHLESLRLRFFKGLHGILPSLRNCKNLHSLHLEYFGDRRYPRNRIEIPREMTDLMPALQLIELQCSSFILDSQGAMALSKQTKLKTLKLGLSRGSIIENLFFLRDLKALSSLEISDNDMQISNEQLRLVINEYLGQKSMLKKFVHFSEYGTDLNSFTALFRLNPQLEVFESRCEHWYNHLNPAKFPSEFFSSIWENGHELRFLRIFGEDNPWLHECVIFAYRLWKRSRGKFQNFLQNQYDRDFEYSVEEVIRQEFNTEWPESKKVFPI